MYKSTISRNLKLLVGFLFASLCVATTIGCRSHSTLPTATANSGKSIVILFENDVHCAIDGYPALAGLRDAIADTAYTQLVCSGDFIQGGTIGAISKGSYIIEVLSKMGYNAITLGNHEFDFRTPQLLSLLKDLNPQVTCCNFIEKATGKTVYNDFVLSEVGDKKIAYIGVTTTSTLMSMPTAFYAEDGTMEYDLVPEQIADRVQRAADHARRVGANYVIVLSHLGEKSNENNLSSYELVAATSGIDAVLDGHTHSVVRQQMVRNKEGIEVPVSQTGTLFSNVGKLVIMPNGAIEVSLPAVSNISERSEAIQAEVDRIKADAEAVTNRVVAKSDVDLILRNHKGYEITRLAESNTGDLVTDAYRIITGADIGLLNAGAIRNSLKAGDLTYGDLMSLLPYDNLMCVAEATGAQLLNLLVVNTAKLPRPDGQFPAVSGMHYTVDANTHEVSNVTVLNKDSGQYEPLDLERVYTIASTDYAICNGGFRNTLAEARILRQGFMSYCDAFIEYVTQHLNGHITQDYAEVDNRITVTGIDEILK